MASDSSYRYQYSHSPPAVGTFTSARLVCVAGREGYLPAMFGRLHKSRQTPVNAILLQAAITIAFIVIGGGFRSLINFSVVASWSFYFLTVCGVSREDVMMI
jgi:amino acid transporter